MMKCCFDKRIWIALGVPPPGLPVRGSPGGRGARAAPAPAATAPGGEPAAGAVNRAAEIARLRREIELLKRHASGAGGPVGAVTLPSGEGDPFGGAADPVAPARRAP